MKQLALFLVLLSIGFSLYSQDKKTIPLNSFSSDLTFHDGLLAVKNNETGKWGFIDTLGNIRVPFEWEFNNNPAFGGGVCALSKRVNNKTTWYLVNKNGNSTALSSKFNKISNFNKDGIAYAIIVEGQALYKLIYINSKGQQIFPALSDMSSRYADLNEAPPAFYNGLARFIRNEKYGFINKQGKIVVPAKLTRAHDFSDGLAAVYFSDNANTPLRWGYINTNGELAIPAIYSNEVGDFYNGYARVMKKNNMYVYINKNGEVTSNEYPAASRFFNGYAFVTKYKGHAASLMNDNMEVLYELDETFKGGYSKTNTFYGDWNMLQYKGNYILVKGGTGADDIKIIDAMGNNILWGITKICSDNIAVRGNPFSGRCVFYNIEQKEPIFSIEQSEF